MSAETWGIGLRDRATGAEQWVACEVTRDDRGRFKAKSAAGDDGMSYAFDLIAVASHGRWIERTDPSLALDRIEPPAAYAAHMERMRLTLAVDEVERLRAEVTRLADTLGAIGRSVGAESCERDVILAAIRERGEDAFRRGAEAAMVAAIVAARRDGAWGIAEAIRHLPLPTEATPPPAQSIVAPATPDVPLSLADAAARARSAAAQRAQ